MHDMPVPLRLGTNLPVSFGDPALDTPAVLVDLDIVDANIGHMAGFAARNGFALRPHIKTHKSPAMAHRQIAAGAVGICVATVTEAEAMVAGGVTDVLVAYPLVGSRKFERLAPLLGRARITLVADSTDVVRSYDAFAASVGGNLPVLVEVDTGMHRIGVSPEHVLSIAHDVRCARNLTFQGIMTHAGQTHDVTTAPEIASIARREAETMGMIKCDLEREGFDVEVVSAGSTITAPYFRADDAVTEVRPGIYIYNDLRTLSLFACTPDALAASALATVVSVNGDRVTIDAGNKTLTVSKDAAFGYGLLVEDDRARFTRLSEEHGVLDVPDGEVRFAVGQRVRALPVHVCVWMDLQPEIYGVRAGQVVERISVDAMRHSL